VLGFQDECWWTRLAQPGLHAWTAGDPLRLVGNTRDPKGGLGCRIRVCGLSVKAPWLNAIEPKWVHGKRAIVEPNRKLSTDEVQQRACDYYGCKPQPLLAKPAT
jgi:hypothetical protein